MAIHIEENGKDVWEIRCAPQCMTDILVQVRRVGTEMPLFAFHIGDLLREEVEAHGDLGGMMQVDDEQSANLNRWADQLEIYAALIRTALQCRRDEDSAIPA